MRNLSNLVVVAIILFVLACLSVAVYQNYQFNHMTPDEHLSAAHDDVWNADYDDAQRHLDAIPKTSLAHDSDEFDQVADALKKHKAALEQQTESENRTLQSSLPEVLCMGGNDVTNGQRHFQEFMSLDNGKSWVDDDGSCVKAEQKERDADAKMYSYWPTTVRVEADINQSWLNHEERVCTSYPSAEGRVDRVICNPDAYNTGHNRLHDIPITFWGGVDRGHRSNWRCRREGDDFVCWAID